MAIRTINYTVTADGITPKTKQLIGVQGEHKATTLAFKVKSELLTKISSEVGTGTLKYRFDAYSGGGDFFSTAPVTISPIPSVDTTYNFPIEERLTRQGGNIQVRIVFTIENTSGEEVTTAVELISFSAICVLDGVPDAAQSDEDSRESITTLADKAKEYMEAAEDSAEEAEGYKNNAAASASSASASAGTAATKALEANASAVSAAESASEAYSSEAEARECALNADDYAQDANSSKTSAAASAASASSSATDAATSASAAAASAASIENQKGQANGIASLDGAGKVPSAQLPSYVDDVLEFNSASDFPETGESGKIYIAKDTNKTYRWGGSSYVSIGSDLALGETSSTAYRGDRGKTAYEHSQATGNPHGLVASDIISTQRGVELSNGVIALSQAFYNYLEEKTYTAPSISSFSITGLGGTVEIGTSVSVSALTHKETNIAFITGNLTLKKDGTTIKSDIEPSAGSASVEFDAQTVTRNTGGNVTFTLSGVNSRGASFSASASKSFYVPKFTGTNENATVTESNILAMTRGRNLVSAVTLSSLSYVYWVTPGTINSITNQTVPVPFERINDVAVTINGVSYTYHIYRTQSRLLSGSSWNFVYGEA